ncbi:MAG: hypothetical protein ACLR0U_21000 [Enterocloster clostridioformis]
MGKKVFIDLTHPFSADIPRWPYFDKPLIDNAHTMAREVCSLQDYMYHAHWNPLRCAASCDGIRV